MTPLTPLSPHERLGWLDGVKTIRCLKSLPEFDAGRLYRVQTKIHKTKSLTIRLTEGRQEDVTVTGDEFFIVALDNLHRRNLFTDHEPPSMRGFHCVRSTLLLADHFVIPHVPDVANVHSLQFRSLIQHLSTL